MAKRQSKKETALWQLAIFASAIALCIYSISQRQYGPSALFGFAALVMALWFVAVRVPTYCGVITLKGLPCRNRTTGILLGCGKHTWDKFLAWFGYHRKRPESRRFPQSSPTSPVQMTPKPEESKQVSGVEETTRNTILFWATIISTGAGVGSMIVGVIAIA